MKQTGWHALRAQAGAAIKARARAERFKKHQAQPVFGYAFPASQFGAAIKSVDAETRALIDAAVKAKGGKS